MESWSKQIPWVCSMYLLGPVQLKPPPFRHKGAHWTERPLSVDPQRLKQTSSHLFVVMCKTIACSTLSIVLISQDSSAWPSTSAWPSRARPRMATPIESQLLVNITFLRKWQCKKELCFHSKTITIIWPSAKKKSIYHDYPLFQRSQTSLLQNVPL